MLWDCFWGHFWPKVALQLSLLSEHLCMYDSNLYRRPHAMQWPLLKSPNFWASSAEYYIGLLSLGWGHNIVRLDTRVLGSLRHAARLKTSWLGQWLRYLAAVVSIIQYLIKGAWCVTVMTVGDRWGIAPMPHILWGQLPPLSPPPPFHCLCTIFNRTTDNNNRAESQGEGSLTRHTPFSKSERFNKFAQELSLHAFVIIILWAF